MKTTLSCPKCMQDFMDYALAGEILTPLPKLWSCPHCGYMFHQETMQEWEPRPYEEQVLINMVEQLLVLRFGNKTLAELNQETI